MKDWARSSMDRVCGFEQSLPQPIENKRLFRASKLSQSLGEAISRFQIQLRGAARSPDTITWYRQILGTFAATVGPDKPLKQIEPNDVSTWLVNLEPTHSQATRARYFVGIKTFLETSGHKLPIIGPKRPKRLITPLDKFQIQTLLKAVDGNAFHSIRNHAMVSFMLDAMVRVGELCSLQIANCDIPGQTAKVIGKGNKERRVPFGKACQASLLRYLARRGEIPGQPYFFVTHYGLKMQRHYVALWLQRVGKRLGFRVTPHLCRHSGATSYIRNGGDPVSLKEILGHSTLDMVMEYVKLADADISAKHGRFSPLDNLEEPRRVRLK